MQDLAFRSCDPLSQGEFVRWLQTVPAGDLNHYELLDGFIVMEPPAGWPHGRIEALVVGRLHAFLGSSPGGHLFGSSQGFHLSTGDTVEPDVAFVCEERWRKIAQPIRGFPRVVPDLVVEILSPSTRKIDEKQKKGIYERNGVREYWMIDAESRSVRQMVMTERGFGEGRILSSGEVLVSQVLSGLRIPVAELFPD